MNQLRVQALRSVMGDLSQRDFAEKHDLNASYISQILTGHRAFGERSARNMEEKIGLPFGTLSRPLFDIDRERPDAGADQPTAKPSETRTQSRAQGDQSVLDALNAMTEVQARLLAGKLTKAQVSMLRELRATLAEPVTPRKAQSGTSSVVPIRPAAAEEADTFNIDENVLVRQSTAKIAAGHGEQNTHVDIDRELAFKKSWIKRKGLNPAYLIVAYASGSSMSPRIEDGDAVLIDTATKELKSGKIFAFKDGEREDIIKRAVKEKGVWLLRSDNPDKSVPEYQDMPFLDEDGQQRFEIVGLAHWRGGDL